MHSHYKWIGSTSTWNIERASSDLGLLVETKTWPLQSYDTPIPTTSICSQQWWYQQSGMQESSEQNMRKLHLTQTYPFTFTSGVSSLV